MRHVIHSPSDLGEAEITPFWLDRDRDNCDQDSADILQGEEHLACWTIAESLKP